MRIFLTFVNAVVDVFHVNSMTAAKKIISREEIYEMNLCVLDFQAVSDAMLVELKQCFMEAYDDNQDGKIDIRELAQLLPMEENFLLLFRFDNPLESSVEFMKVSLTF